MESNAIALIESGSLERRTVDRCPYGDLPNHRVGLDDATDAFETRAAGTSYRATIHPWSDES